MAGGVKVQSRAANQGRRCEERGRHAVSARERGQMAKSRREFLGTASAGLIAALAAPDALPGAVVDAAQQQPADGPAGAPPAYGTGPAFGPEVSTKTFAEAEKLVQISLNSEERTEAAESWRVTMAALYERRGGAGGGVGGGGGGPPKFSNRGVVCPVFAVESGFAGAAKRACGQPV